MNEEVLSFGDEVYVIKKVRCLKLSVDIKQLYIYVGARNIVIVNDYLCTFEQFVELFHNCFQNQAFFVEGVDFCYILPFKHIIRAKKSTIYIDHRNLQHFHLPPETSLEPWLNSLKPDKTLQNMVEAMWDAPGMPGANQILNEFLE